MTIHAKYLFKQRFWNLHFFPTEAFIYTPHPFFSGSNGNYYLIFSINSSLSQLKNIVFLVEFL